MFFAFTTQNAVASFQSIHSAVRYQGETVQNAHRRYLERLTQSGYPLMGQGNQTVMALAKPLNQTDFSRVTQWPNLNYLTQAFKWVRDIRFARDLIHNLLRRSSWLYPDDGCFARASWMEKNLDLVHAQRPNKLFIFGNLEVKTVNSPAGLVRWWFHVVPIVRVSRQLYVLDPAIDPSQPLTLKNWVLTMTPNPDSVSVAICDSHAYVPENSCLTPTIHDEDSLSFDQDRYLEDEWKRELVLGRDPIRELGDYPPWLRR